jgi:ribA/ribD-fused uncharacterized protein
VIDNFTGKYRFLSNFYPAVVEFDGQKYPSTEHAFQAAKTLNLQARVPFQVGGSFTAGQAKRHGKTLDLRPDWESVKIGIMYELNVQKFQDLTLRRQLLATEDQVLVEGNDWGDTFWGVCDGEGANMLGKILMQVRENAAKE